MIEHVIDCDAYPSVPALWSVEEHKKSGFFKFDPAKISLYLSRNQRRYSVSGNDLRKVLTNKSVMNANVLDYLRLHQELIPEEWKGRQIVFWGTIYRGNDGLLYVRYLFWNGARWDWFYSWIGPWTFDSNTPAALEKCS